MVPGLSSSDTSPPHVSSALMPAADLVITSSRVVTDDGVGPAAVAITGEKITAVARPGVSVDAHRRLDVGHSVVMAGVVDTHVHVNDPGRTAWDGVETATPAAAAGGGTPIRGKPLNSLPVTTTPRA